MIKGVLFVMFFSVNLVHFAHAISCTDLLSQKLQSDFYQLNVVFNIPMSNLRTSLSGNTKINYNIIIENPHIDEIDMFDVSNSKELNEDLNDLNQINGDKEGLVVQGELVQRANGRLEFQYKGLVARPVTPLTIRPIEQR